MSNKTYICKDLDGPFMIVPCHSTDEFGFNDLEGYSVYNPDLEVKIKENKHGIMTWYLYGTDGNVRWWFKYVSTHNTIEEPRKILEVLTL